MNACYCNQVKHWFLKRDAIEAFKSVGGVRIEDDVLVTSGGIDNLTTVAKRARDIEEFMRQ
jgi:Xaa-Pro dipeptidase